MLLLKYHVRRFLYWFLDITECCYCDRYIVAGGDPAACECCYDTHILGDPATECLVERGGRCWDCWKAAWRDSKLFSR